METVGNRTLHKVGGKIKETATSKVRITQKGGQPMIKDIINHLVLMQTHLSPAFSHAQTFDCMSQ